MIHLKVFISSVQKELRQERIAVGSFLATDEFLRDCTAPRIYEDYPQPLRPNPKGYLDLLRTCQVYLLIIGLEYGADAGEGLSATHEEYRLAQELRLPTLVCIKGLRATRREPKVDMFLEEIAEAKHTYSRFANEAELLKVVSDRLCEHIKTTYDTEPRRAQIEQSRLTQQSASPFEREPVVILTFDDLDPGLMHEMMAAAEESDKDQIDPKELPRLLLSRGYLWRDGDVLRPTNAGALLLARRPPVALPQSRIQVDAFPGTTRNTDAVDSGILAGPLSRLVEQAVAFVRRNTAKPLVVKGLKRQKTETYPAEVLREAVVNAVAHREYSDAGAKVAIEVYADRLLIRSPGEPPGGQTADRLASGQARSRSRNPLIVQGLAWLELMDERGSGIPRMTRLLEQAGHPKPSFRIEHDSLVLELRPANRNESDRKADRPSDVVVGDAREQTTREMILAEVKASGTISTKTCVQKLGVARATAQRALSDLVEENILETVGSGRATHYHLKSEAVTRRKRGGNEAIMKRK
jgi:predicted HTH transcriptional regulator